MSYELYITRAEGWSEAEHFSDSQSRKITLEEWGRLVNDDSELEIDYTARLSDEELARIVASHPEFAGCQRGAGGLIFSKEQDQILRRVAAELKQGDTLDIGDLAYDTADWISHPKGELRCFWFHDGAISTKNPDIATLNKLLQLAKLLDAIVRGDDEEIYRRSDRGLECFEPDRGWLPLEQHHRGRPDWASAIIREIAG